MAIPFARSTRSMNQDRFLPGIIAILLISLILILWMTWLFTGQLTVYATTAEFSIREDGMLLCVFPAGSLPQLKPGQQTELILVGLDDPSAAPIPGEVMNVPAIEEGPVEVYLFTSEPLPPDVSGKLKVKVGQTSPASLIWHSIQK